MLCYISRHRFAIWLFCLLYAPAWAQTIQSLLWNVPDGNLTDLSQTFTNGDTLPLSWNALVTTSYVDTTQNLVDLWVTSFDENLNTFNQSLTQNINLTVPGTYAWTIAIPDKNLAISAKYVLRFKKTSSTYDINSGELSSPGFLVLRAAPSTSSTSTSSTSTATTSSTSASSTLSHTIPITSTSPPSQTSTPTQHSEPSGLSTGAKAGVGIGVAIAVLGACGILYFCMRRRNAGATSTEVIGQQVDYKYGSNAQPVELPGTWNGTSHVRELGTENATELQAR